MRFVWWWKYFRFGFCWRRIINCGLREVPDMNLLSAGILLQLWVHYRKVFFAMRINVNSITFKWDLLALVPHCVCLFFLGEFHINLIKLINARFVLAEILRAIKLAKSWRTQWELGPNNCKLIISITRLIPRRCFFAESLITTSSRQFKGRPSMTRRSENCGWF